MPHACHLHSSSLPPPLCLTPVQCPDLEISTLRLPGSGARVPRRAHLSDDCSVPAIVRSSAPHCRSFDSNGAVLGPKFQKLPHNPSHWGLAKHKLMNLEGSNPSSACQWDGPQSYGACGHQNNSQTMVLPLRCFTQRAIALTRFSLVRTVRQSMKMVRLMPITSITGVTIQFANNM